MHVTKSHGTFVQKRPNAVFFVVWSVRVTCRCEKQTDSSELSLKSCEDAMVGTQQQQIMEGNKMPHETDRNVEYI